MGVTFLHFKVIINKEVVIMNGFQVCVSNWLSGRHNVDIGSDKAFILTMVVSVIGGCVVYVPALEGRNDHGLTGSHEGGSSEISMGVELQQRYADHGFLCWN